MYVVSPTEKQMDQQDSPFNSMEILDPGLNRVDREVVLVKIYNVLLPTATTLQK